MLKLIVVAKVVAKRESVTAVKSALLTLVEQTRQENGCLQYLLHEDKNDPAVFVFYETWENQVCLERHMNTDHFMNYLQAVDGLIAEKVVHIMNRIK